MKRLSIFLAFLALTLPALAQVETFTDTLKENTTQSILITPFAEHDSMRLNFNFPDSASGRIRLRAIARVNGINTPLTADTIMVKEFGPNVGASNVRVSWFEIKAAAVQWHVFPVTFFVDVIFYDDAATYGGFADQSTKLFALHVTRYRRFLTGPLPVESYTDTLKRSTTMSVTVDLADLDSLNAVFSYPDSAMGRIRATASNSIAGVTSTVAADTAMIKLLTGKNVGGGQNRVSWAQLLALSGSPGRAMPRYLTLELIFDATVTAHGGARPTKLAQIDVRKYRHK